VTSVSALDQRMYVTIADMAKEAIAGLPDEDFDHVRRAFEADPRGSTEIVPVVGDHIELRIAN
jgi:hypothetical protein